MAVRRNPFLPKGILLSLAAFPILWVSSVCAEAAAVDSERFAGAEVKLVSQPSFLGTAGEERTSKAILELPPPDVATLKAEDEQEAGKGRPLRIGIVQEVGASPRDSGAEWVTRGGVPAWSIIVNSPGAVGVQLHVTGVRLPQGASLFVEGAGGRVTGRGQNGDGDVWLPTVWGDSATLTVLGCAASEVPELLVLEVSHIYRDFLSIPKVDCPELHLDVSCYPEWSAERDSVARYSFVASPYTYVCTGCLLADSDPSTQIPYFLTANHCIDVQSEANSMVFYWLYQTSECSASPPPLGGVPHTTGGAILLVTDSSVDSTLLRLSQEPPAGTALSGWTTEVPNVGDTVVSIHHPGGEYKRISFGEVVDPRSSANTKIQVIWNEGTTELGSSGGPLYDSMKRFIGDLCGGTSCTTGVPVVDEYAKFERFHPEVAQYLGVGQSPTPTPVPALSLRVSSASGACGEIVSVSVDVAEATGIDAFGMTLHYDATQLSFIEALPGTVCADWASVAGSEGSPGQVTIGGFKGGGTPVIGSGELAVVRFVCTECPSTAILTLSNLVDDVLDAEVVPGQVVCETLLPTDTPADPPTSTPVIPTETPLEPTSTPLPPTPSPPAAAASVALIVESVGVPGCGSFQLSILVSGVVDMDSFGMKVIYPSADLNYLSTAAGSLCSDWAAVDGSEPQPGQVTVGGFRGAGTAVNGSGQLALLTFECVTCPSESQLDLASLVDDVAGASVTPGTVLCGGVLPTPTPTDTPTPTETPIPTETPTAGMDPRADINQDGCVNVEDLLILLRNWQLCQ